jgi:hypothetical protein
LNAGAVVAPKRGMMWSATTSFVVISLSVLMLIAIFLVRVVRLLHFVLFPVRVVDVGIQEYYTVMLCTNFKNVLHSSTALQDIFALSTY